MDVDDNDYEDDVVEIDNVDDIDSGMIMAIGGHYGILDWRGFHPSPDPTLKEEIRRNPMSAISNRLARAKILKKDGCLEIAQELIREALYIRRTIDAKSQVQVKKSEKTKLRFKS